MDDAVNAIKQRSATGEIGPGLKDARFVPAQDADVEKLLAGSAPPKLKERSLFVLAQSASPRAKTLLAEIAKGKGNPDLQLKALDYLGAFGSGPDVPLLVDVYKSTGDVDVKKRVIRSLGMSGRRGVFLGGVYGSTAFYSPANTYALAEAIGQYERVKIDADAARTRAEADRVRSEAQVLARDRAAVAGGKLHRLPVPVAAVGHASPAGSRSRMTAVRSAAWLPSPHS